MASLRFCDIHIEPFQPVLRWSTNGAVQFPCRLKRDWVSQRAVFFVAI